jgi:AAA+ ATPase superfamily predicted ATPase
MTSAVYSSDVPKTADELALEDVVRRLVYRLQEAREDSAAERMVLRQLEGIRRGSELGALLMQEYDADPSSVDYW